MNTLLKLFLSMSFFGSLLILALLVGKRFWKNKISRQWQYYIWFVVILRLLLPLGLEIHFTKKTEDFHLPAFPIEQSREQAGNPIKTPTVEHTLQNIQSFLTHYAWLIWLMTAAGLLIRKITIYQSFVRYIKAGMTPVSDIDSLNQLSIIAEQAGIKRPAELFVNPLISSPLLIGIFHPSIVLPSKDISEKDLPYIILHELIHYKRRDIFYKWLMQATLCLHWFNPLVYLMSLETIKACEFSCDEAVLAKMGCGHAQDYGKTLLHAMAAVGKYKESLGAVTLNKNKQLLKERLSAIMNFQKKSKTIQLSTGMLTLCIGLMASLIGVYPVSAVSSSPIELQESLAPDEQVKELSFTQAEQYYESDSLYLFQIAFSQMDEAAQSAWLDKIYADGKIAFFSASVSRLNADSPLLENLAEKFYKDGSVSFFSVLASQMSEDTLHIWLDRALEDKNPPFQSVLFNKLEMEDKLDEQEKEWEKKQLEEYQAVGVTKNGKNYYYQEQLVNIFLDIRPNKSFYTLDMNPAGTVNIKIIRGEDEEITGAAYMTEAEVNELLNALYDPDDDFSD